MRHSGTSRQATPPGGTRRRLAGAALALVVQTSATGEEVFDATLQGNRLVEHHASEVKVSGNIIVGVMATSAYRGLAADRLAIRSPDSGKTSLCLKVTSRDGAYSSANDYHSTRSPATIRLPYKSGIPAVLGRYTGEPGDIAITATRGICGPSAPTDYYLPVDLDNGSGRTSPLTIYVNGFDATDVYYTVDAAAGGDCDYIEAGRHTAYNFRCEIASLPVAADRPAIVGIAREVYGRELKPLTIRIHAIP